MEKTWEKFCMTGKVTDYLAYRNCAVSEQEKWKEKKEQISDGTVGGIDRNGFNSHAY